MIKETIDALTTFHPVKKFHNLFILDKISDKKKENVRRAYGGEIDSDEEILIIQDDTVFGKADNGFAITEKALYYNLSDPKGGFKRQYGKITIEFIFDPTLGKLALETKCLTFNGIKFGNLTLLDKTESDFLNELFEALHNLKQEGTEKKGKDSDRKKTKKASPNTSKISPECKFIYFQNGDQYFGEVKGESLHGFGIYHYNKADNRERYEGNWKEGSQYGKGILKFKSGEQYDGEYKDGKRYGKGIEIWPDGMLYEGEWKDDKRDGQGILIWKSGERYEGEWKDDKRYGKGIQTWPDGIRYEGEWKDGKRFGKGIQTWPDGTCYDGGWKDDTRKYGEMVYLDGNKYHGEWQEDKRHGTGTYYDKKGAIIFQGQWNEDVFVGAHEGTISDESGTYTGQIDNQKKHGKGVMNYSKRKDGLIKFEGEWKNDKTIKGTYFFEGGETITGTFSGDYTSGKGKITQNDGLKFEGTWENLQSQVNKNKEVSLIMIPKLQKIIFAKEFLNDDFRGKFIFETEQDENSLHVASIDEKLDSLIKDEQCDKALKIIEEVRKKAKREKDSDEQIQVHLNKREEAVIKLKNEILHREILNKFGVSSNPEPERTEKEKPKDDFDDFA